jgi:hypothetical protein
MPRIFTQIDLLMKAFFQSKPAAEISPLLPDGVVKFGERWVTSQPIALGDHSTCCYIKGKFDTVVEFSDGSFGVVDFKTSRPTPGHVRFYSRQLHAYAYALEHPAARSLALAPISRLGLLCVEPEQLERTSGGRIAYAGSATWLECPKDDRRFLAFLDEVLTVLERPSPPARNPECIWCKYRDDARASGF